MGFCRGVCAFPVIDFLLVFFLVRYWVEVWRSDILVFFEPAGLFQNSTYCMFHRYFHQIYYRSEVVLGTPWDEIWRQKTPEINELETDKFSHQI